MKVFVVSVEYAESRGENPFAVVAVTSTEDRAYAIARAQADGYLAIDPGANIVISGQYIDDERTNEAWDLWIDVNEFDVE
jgi:hypothetical protein